MDAAAKSTLTNIILMASALAALGALGLMLRPTPPNPPAGAAAITLLQMLVLSGFAAAVAGRAGAAAALLRSAATVLVAGVAGTFIAVVGILPAQTMVRAMSIQTCWAIFVFGISAWLSARRPFQATIPITAMAISVIAPLWPILGSPLIQWLGQIGFSWPQKVLLSLCPSIWLIKATDSQTGFNTMAWFHSRTLYHVVPLGQNVLMPQVWPWLPTALAMAGIGSALIYCVHRRRCKAAGATTASLATMGVCR